ncbi:MAG: hypothetical protein NVSMB4_01570 [Acidimicrobiales bacterium]
MRDKWLVFYRFGVWFAYHPDAFPRAHQFPTQREATCYARCRAAKVNDEFARKVASGVAA